MTQLFAGNKCKYCRLPFAPARPEQDFCSGRCRRVWRMEVRKRQYYDAEMRARLPPFDCPWEHGPVLVDGQPAGIPEDWPDAPEAPENAGGAWTEGAPDIPLPGALSPGTPSPDALSPESRPGAAATFRPTAAAGADHARPWPVVRSLGLANGRPPVPGLARPLAGRAEGGR